MPKPRRRRRFFALEGRLEVDDTGEVGGVYDSEHPGSITFEPSVEMPEPTSGDANSEHAGYEEQVGASTKPEDETLPPAFRLNRAPKHRPSPKRFFSFPSVLFSLGCTVCGLLAGYLLARPTQAPARAKATANVQKEASSLTRQDQEDLDAAYSARHAHRYDDAKRIFTALKHRHPGWGPMEIELGRTLFYEGDSYAASSLLKVAADGGVSPAEANFLLALLNKARKNFPAAEACFEKSVAIDPTQPEYYFFWGECLRDEGKLMDATAKFRSALLRNQYETATGLYRAKLWLCVIEAGAQANDGVSAQIDLALAEPRPTLEALVAAAARDLTAGDLRAAAAHLSAASQRADPIVFRYILSDPFFASALAKPEFAEFIQSAPPAAGPATEAVASPPAPAATP